MTGSCCHGPVPDSVERLKQGNGTSDQSGPKPMPKVYRVDGCIVIAGTYAEAVQKFCRQYDVNEIDIKSVHMIDDSVIL